MPHKKTLMSNQKSIIINNYKKLKRTDWKQLSKNSLLSRESTSRIKMLRSKSRKLSTRKFRNLTKINLKYLTSHWKLKIWLHLRIAKSWLRLIKTKQLLCQLHKIKMYRYLKRIQQQFLCITQLILTKTWVELKSLKPRIQHCNKNKI